MSETSNITLRQRDAKRKAGKPVKDNRTIANESQSASMMSPKPLSLSTSFAAEAGLSQSGPSDMTKWLTGEVTTPSTNSVDIVSTGSPRAVNTPRRLELLLSSSKPQPPGVRSVLKLYMENQLELNTEEMQQYEEAIDVLLADIANLEQERDVITERLTASTIEKEELAAANTELSQRNEDLSMTVDDLKNQVAQLELNAEAAHSLRHNVTQLTAELEAARAAEADWRNKFSTQSEHLSNVKGRLSYANEQNNALLAELEAERDAQLAIAAGEKQATTDSDSYRSQIRALEAEVVEKNVTIADMANTIKALEADLDETISRCEDALQDKNNEYFELEKLLEDVQMQLRKQILDSQARHGPASSPRGNTTELRKEITALEDANRQKDITNRELILQLELVQAAVQERQQENTKLHEQINNLKGQLESLSMNASEKQSNAVESENALHLQLSEFETELRLANEINAKLTESLTDATKRYVAAEESLAIVNHEASTQRQRIDSIMVGLASVRTGRTPTESPRSTRVTPTSTPQSQGKGSIFFPTGSEESLIGQHDHIEQRLIHVQKAIADLNNQLESERSHVASKAARILQLSSELETARVDLDLANRDIENRQIHIERLEADRAAFEDRERTLTSDFSTIIERLEKEVMDAFTALEEKEFEMASLLDERNQLQEELSMLQRRNELSNDAFFAQLQSDKDALAAELSEINEKNLEMHETNIAHMDTINELKQELVNRAKEHADRESELALKLSLLESANAAEKEAIQTDVQTTITRLTQHLAAINEEKSDIQKSFSAHKEKIHALEHALLDRGRVDVNIIEMLRQFHSAVAKQEQQLIENTYSRMQSLEHRIRQCQLSSTGVIRAVQRSHALRVAEYKNQLSNLTAALNTAHSAAEGSAQERTQLLESLKENVIARNEMEDSLEETSENLRIAEERIQELIDEQSQRLEGVLETNANELLLIKERLEFAETRGREMAATSAQAFAASSRTIAYLEGECRRLTSVSDHFRAVNAKLMADLSLRNEYSVEIRALQHRLLVASQCEESLRFHIKSLEAHINEKDRAVLDSQETSQLLEQQYNDQMDKLRAAFEEKDRLRVERINSLMQEVAALSDANLSASAQYESELEQARIEIRDADHRYSSIALRAKNLEEDVHSLELNIKDQSESIADLQSEMRAVEAEREMLSDSLEARKVEYEGALHLRLIRIKELEASLASVRKTVAELESSHQLKDEVITSSLAKQTAFAEENRDLRAMADANLLEIMRWTEAHGEVSAELQLKEAAFERLATEFRELKDIIHPETIHQLDTTREISRSQADEIERLKALLTKSEAHVIQLTETLHRSESRLHSFQTELAEAQGSLHAAQTKNTTLTSDNQHLHAQLDDLTIKCANASRDLANSRSSIAEKENSIELYLKRITELESSLLLTDGQCNSFEVTQEALASEMRKFFDYLCSVEGGAVVELPSAQKGDEFSQSGMDATTALNLASEFFSSPVPSNLKLSGSSTLGSATKSARSTPYTGSGSLGGVTPRSNPFSSVRQSYEDIRGKAVSLLQSMQRIKDELAIVSRDCVENTKRADSAELELAMAQRKISELNSENSTLTFDVENARRYANELAASRSEILSEADQLARNVINGLTNLDSFVADTVARANTGLIGRLIARPNGAPISISIAMPNVQRQAAITPVRGENTVAVDFGVSALLGVSVQIVEGTLVSFGKALEAVIGDAALKASTIESLEIAARDNDRNWSRERSSLHDQNVAMQAELTSVLDTRNRLELDLQNADREIEKLRLLVREFSTQREELEAEYRASLENFNSLQGSLGEAETFCLDLQNRHRMLDSDLTTKNEELKIIAAQLEHAQRRANAAESMVQKLQSDCERFKSERDSISTVRKTLELELERTRTDLSNAVTQAQNRLIMEEESKARFALEKLLSSLGSTLDQISSNFLSSAATNMSGLNVSAIDLDNSSHSLLQTQQSEIFSPIAHRLRGSSSVVGDNSFSSTDTASHQLSIGDLRINGNQTAQDAAARVDLAVKRLAELRTWSRDESRARRSLLEKVDLLTSELSRTSKLAQEASADLRLSVSKEMEKSAELKERLREIADLREQIRRNGEELEKQRKEQSIVMSLLEDEKRLKSKLQLDAQAKESEIRKITLKCDHSEASLMAVQDELTAVQTRLSELTAEYESCNELLRATKANNARLSSSLGMLEKGLDKDLTDRGILQQRLTEVQGTASESIRLRHQVSELDSTVAQLKLQLRQFSLANDALDDLNKKLTSDNDNLKRKLASLESRLELALREKHELQQENNEIRLEAAKANHLCEMESAAKTKAEVALAALSRDGRSRQGVEDYSALVEEVEGKFHIDEEEKNILRHSNHTLKLALEEKDAQKHADQLKISKLEKELALVKSKLSRSTVELLEANNKASTLRSQGRKARTHVLEIVSELRGLVELVRADAPSVLGTGVDLAFLLEAEPVAASTNVGLEEALGVPELTSITKQLSVAVSAVHQPGRARNIVELESNRTHLESENSRLLDALMQVETESEEKLKKQRDEMQQLQIELVEMRRHEAANKQISKQLGALENIIKQEREEKERSIALLEKFKAESDSMSKELSMLKKSSIHNTLSSSMQSDLQAEIDRLCATLSKAQDDLFVARQELSSINHHRALLRDTIEQLERSLRSKSEALAEYETGGGVSSDRLNSSRSHLRSTGGVVTSTGTGSQSTDEQQIRQIARLRARVSCMEEVVSLYRSGLLALYPDGSSYGAAQFAGLGNTHGSLPQGHGQQNMKGSSGHSAPTFYDVIQNTWLPREIALIRRSYEDELRLLDCEVLEMKGKLKQNVSYVAELRKRFEDNMKILYRTGHDRVNEGLMSQIDHLTNALSRVEQENAKLSGEIENERSVGRRRHTVLLDELTKSLSTADTLASLIRRISEANNIDNVTVSHALKTIGSDWANVWHEVQNRIAVREDIVTSVLDKVVHKTSGLLVSSGSNSYSRRSSSNEVSSRSRGGREFNGNATTGSVNIRPTSQSFDINAAHTSREPIPEQPATHSMSQSGAGSSINIPSRATSNNSSHFLESRAAARSGTAWQATSLTSITGSLMEESKHIKSHRVLSSSTSNMRSELFSSSTDTVKVSAYESYSKITPSSSVSSPGSPGAKGSSPTLVSRYSRHATNLKSSPK